MCDARENWSRRGRPITDGISDIDMALARRLLCRHARGRVLEVAVGAANNLPFYPEGITLVGVDPEAGQLARAQQRGRLLGRSLETIQARAEELPFADGSFDTVVCTLGLCAVSDPRKAIAEIARVCAGDGQILLLEHTRSTYPVLGVLQDLTNWAHRRWVGCDWNRRTLDTARNLGLRLEEVQDHFLGAVFSVRARPPFPE